MVFKPGERRLRPVRAWFLKIDPVRIVGMCVCVCVCLRPRLLITCGVIWRDMNLKRLVKQILQLLYGNYSRIVNGRGLSIDTRRRY